MKALTKFGLFCIAAMSFKTSLLSPAQTSGTTSSTQDLGSVTAFTFKNGLQWNTYGNQQEFASAAAAGATGVRLNCVSWATFEQQSASPNNTSSGFAIPTSCQQQIRWAATYGMNVTMVWVYGPPYHNVLNVTTTAAVSVGATSVPVVVSSTVNGFALSNAQYPYVYLSCPTCSVSGISSVFTGKHFYAGSLITSITMTDATHGTANLSSAVATPLASGLAMQLNRLCIRSV